MKIVNLYRSGNAVGPNPAEENQAVHGYRLVADEGFELVNGETVLSVVDVGLDGVSEWTEREAEEELSWSQVGRILAGEGEGDSDDDEE